VKQVVFWFLLVFGLWTRCGSGVFFHMLHGRACLCVWGHVVFAIESTVECEKAKISA
jgi:hypothetical protein